MSRNDSPSHDLVRRETPPHGSGVFAGRTFHAGEMIIKFGGAFYTSAEMPSPYEAVEDKWLQVGEDLYLGPSSGGLDDFINHSCDPNAALRISEATDRQTDRQTANSMAVRITGNKRKR